MKTKYFDGKHLDDKAIPKAIRRAAELYEDGAIIEASDILTNVIDAIDAFVLHEEEE